MLLLDCLTPPYLGPSCLFGVGLITMKISYLSLSLSMKAAANLGYIIVS